MCVFISPNFHCSRVQYILMPLAQYWSKIRLWMAETDSVALQKRFPPVQQEQPQLWITKQELVKAQHGTFYTWKRCTGTVRRQMEKAVRSVALKASRNCNSGVSWSSLRPCVPEICPHSDDPKPWIAAQFVGAGKNLTWIHIYKRTKQTYHDKTAHNGQGWKQKVFYPSFFVLFFDTVKWVHFHTSFELTTSVSVTHLFKYMYIIGNGLFWD